MFKASETAIYLVDNGKAYCGNHLGNTARHTGRDISGQRIYMVTPEDARELASEGLPITCETCGRAASALIHVEG